MNRNRLSLLFTAIVAATAFSMPASAAQINGWELDTTALGGASTTGINQLNFTGESYITNTLISGSLYNFTDVGVFTLFSKNAGIPLTLGGGELTAYFDAYGKTDLSTGTFTFEGGTLDFWFQNPGDYGTTAANCYGACNGTKIATFTVTGGGGGVNPDGTPTSNGQVTVTSLLTSSVAGVWQNLNIDLPLNLTMGFVTTNASEDLSADDGTIDPNLVTALAGVTPNNPPASFFVNNGGQFKLESVPEPASLALLGIGLLGMGASLRRRSI